MIEPLKLGTRGSKLALTQSQQVADAVTRATGVPVVLVVISTRGDRITDRPLPEIGGKGLFTLELEEALNGGEIDFAVHSLKDLPTDDPSGLILGAIPQRVDPRDALIGADIAGLKAGAQVGSGSLRRRTQLLQIRPDVSVVDIRGNVPTRLAKCDSGVVDATILAMAGLTRLGISRPDIYPIAVETMIPAVGQGALGIQCREHDPRVGPLLAAIDHRPTREAVSGERAFLAAFGGGCNVPAGCHVIGGLDGFSLSAVVADADNILRHFKATGPDPVALGMAAAAALR